MKKAFTLNSLKLLDLAKLKNIKGGVTNCPPMCR